MEQEKIGFNYTDLMELVSVIHEHQFFKVAEITFIVFSLFFVIYLGINFILNYYNEIIHEKNKLCSFRIHDSVFNEEYDSEMSHSSAIEYIKCKYGENAFDNIEKVVQVCRELELRLLDTLKLLKQTIHLVELEMIDTQTIKDTIDAAGQLTIHCEKEFKVYSNIFKLLSREDQTYLDEYNEVNEIKSRCLILEKRINSISLALLTHQH